MYILPTSIGYQSGIPLLSPIVLKSTPFQDNCLKLKEKLFRAKNIPQEKAFLCHYCISFFTDGKCSYNAHTTCTS